MNIKKTETHYLIEVPSPNGLTAAYAIAIDKCNDSNLYAAATFLSGETKQSISVEGIKEAIKQA